MIERDAAKLAERISRDFPSEVVLTDTVWWASPPARVIDCVLSLRKKYDTVVVPRVRDFVSSHPEITSCQALLDLIANYESPLAFHRAELRMDSKGKATALVGVLEYLVDIQSRFSEETEQERLKAWAEWTRPGDYLTLEVPGFALAGFQYLRMLFGAETVKPDAHMLRYAESVLGKPIQGKARAEMAAVYAYERAAEILGRSARQVDIAIWEHQSGRTHPGRSS